MKYVTKLQYQLFRNIYSEQGFEKAMEYIQSLTDEQVDNIIDLVE